MKIKYLLPITLIAIVVRLVIATTVIPPTFDQLVKQAEFIFQGTVTDTRSVWEGEGGQRHVETYVTFKVDDNVKGDAGASYTIQILGGTVGDQTMEVSDAPKFRIGDRDILFVEHNYDQFVPLVGIDHGRFHIQHDDTTGRDIVVNGEGEPVKNLAKLGYETESVTAAEAMTPEQLKSAIKSQLKAGAGSHPSQ